MLLAPQTGPDFPQGSKNHRGKGPFTREVAWINTKSRLDPLNETWNPHKTASPIVSNVFFLFCFVKEEPIWHLDLTQVTFLFIRKTKKTIPSLDVKGYSARQSCGGERWSASHFSQPAMGWELQQKAFNWENDLLGGPRTSPSEARAGNLKYFSYCNASTPEFCGPLVKPPSMGEKKRHPLRDFSC